MPTLAAKEFSATPCISHNHKRGWDHRTAFLFCAGNRNRLRKRQRLTGLGLLGLAFEHGAPGNLNQILIVSGDADFLQNFTQGLFVCCHFVSSIVLRAATRQGEATWVDFEFSAETRPFAVPRAEIPCRFWKLIPEDSSLSFQG
jgi:hypothetical protein